jgi:hypothetical protein
MWRHLVITLLRRPLRPQARTYALRVTTLFAAEARRACRETLEEIGKAPGSWPLVSDSHR